MLKKLMPFLHNYFSNIKFLVHNRNFYLLMDHILVWSFAFGLIFVLGYKVLLHIEFWLFSTNTLLLPEIIKENLPFAYFIFLCLWIIVKYYFFSRSKKLDDPTTKTILDQEKNHQISFKIFNFRFIVSSKTLYILALVAILATSVAIKVKYMDYPFVGSHPMKYSTYAEPALHMYENNDPLFFKRNYMYNPLNPSNESAKLFGNLPLMEWLLYLGYTTLSGILNVESITHLTSAILGTIALLSLYMFTSKLINKNAGLLATVLFSFNAIFNLASYVTVYDIITFSFTFFSLTLFLDFLKNGSSLKLCWAGILVGIGAGVKTNIFLWALPIVALLLFFKYKLSFEKIVKYITSYFFWALIPFAIVQTTISHFPSKNIWYFVFFVLEIAIALFMINKRELISKFFETLSFKIFAFLNHHKIMYSLFIIIPFFIIFLVYKTDLSEEFLTDGKLIINADLYRWMLTDQFIPYTNVYLSMIFIYSLPLLITIKNSVQRWSLISLLAGMIFYIVLASKVLFFHNYYWIIILAPVYIIATVGIFNLTTIITLKKFRSTFLLITSFSLMLLLYPSTTSKINRDDDDIKKLVTYFQSQNVEDGVSYIDEATSNYILFKTNLNIVYSYEIFDAKELQDKVQEVGFVDAMKYYKILYIVTTTGATPNYLPIANVFDLENNLIENEIRRTDKIYDTLYQTSQYYPMREERGKIIKDMSVDKSYHSIATFGKYTVYGLTDACFIR